MKISGNKRANPIKRVIIVSLLLLIIHAGLILKTQNDITIVKATSKEETFATIITAYETIEQASQEGLAVKSYVDRLNDALDDYYSESYSSAYDKAILIIEEVNNDLRDYKQNKLFRYIIIPFNLLIVATLILFLGMKMVKWQKKRSEEEFLDLEIVYHENESNTEI